MALTDNFIQELKARVRLEDYIGQYVTLKRAGSNLVGCCPFHSEKTPSFTVFNRSDNEHFYCFGCGAGGDVITFVMKMENLTYIQAVEKLATLAGLRMPDDTQRRVEKSIDRARLLEMNVSAARFFRDALFSPGGKGALDYMLKRGFTPLTLRHFGVGFADNSWDSLAQHLIKEGYTPEEMKQNFLAGQAKNGRIFDYFRNRVMFPIFDTAGKVVGFSGRFLGTPGEQDRKYFNTSDTPLYKKSQNLYALNFAKNAGTGYLILCEGCPDAVALHQAGFTSAVATLGTSITSEHARLIARNQYAKTVYTCYDSDKAGQEATKKAIAKLGEVGVPVKVIRIKDAKDPDEFIQKFGKSSFERLLEEAAGHIEFAFSGIRQKYNISLPEERLRFAREVCTLLSSLSSDLERDIYLQKLADETGIQLEILRAQVQKDLRYAAKNAKAERTQEDMRKNAGYSDRVNPDRLKYPSAPKEESLLGLLLLRPEYLIHPKLRSRLTPDIFLCEFHKKLISVLLDLTNDQSTDLSLLSSHFTPEEMGKTVGYKVRREMLLDQGETVVLALIDELENTADRKQTDSSPASMLAAIEELKKQKVGNKNEK